LGKKPASGECLEFRPPLKGGGSGSEKPGEQPKSTKERIDASLGKTKQKTQENAGEGANPRKFLREEGFTRRNLNVEDCGVLVKKRCAPSIPGDRHIVSKRRSPLKKGPSTAPSSSGVLKQMLSRSQGRSETVVL